MTEQMAFKRDSA